MKILLASSLILIAVTGCKFFNNSSETKDALGGFFKHNIALPGFLSTNDPNDPTTFGFPPLPRNVNSWETSHSLSGLLSVGFQGPFQAVSTEALVEIKVTTATATEILFMKHAPDYDRQMWENDAFNVLRFIVLAKKNEDIKNRTAVICTYSTKLEDSTVEKLGGKIFGNGGTISGEQLKAIITRTQSRIFQFRHDEPVQKYIELCRSEFVRVPEVDKTTVEKKFQHLVKAQSLKEATEDNLRAMLLQNASRYLGENDECAVPTWAEREALAKKSTGKDLGDPGCADWFKKTYVPKVQKAYGYNSRISNNLDSYMVPRCIPKSNETISDPKSRALGKCVARATSNTPCGLYKSVKDPTVTTNKPTGSIHDWYIIRAGMMEGVCDEYSNAGGRTLPLSCVYDKAAEFPYNRPVCLRR